MFLKKHYYYCYIIFYELFLDEVYELPMNSEYYIFDIFCSASILVLYKCKKKHEWFSIIQNWALIRQKKIDQVKFQQTQTQHLVRQLPKKMPLEKTPLELWSRFDIETLLLSDYILCTMYNFHDSTDTLKFWTEKRAINRKILFFIWFWWNLVKS